MARNVVLIIITCVIAISCRKHNVDTIYLEIHDIVFDSTSETKSIQFSTSSNWTADVAEIAKSWCKIHTVSGSAGINTMVISVAENSSYDERNALLIISCGKEKEYITITQKQRNALLVDSNKIEVNEGGGTFSITINSNIDCSLVIDNHCASWIHNVTANTKGLNLSQFSIKIDPNEALEGREGSIYIAADGLNEVVTIYQDGASPRVILSEKKIVVPSTGKTIKVEVKSNTEYEYLLPNVDWISEIQSKAQSSFTHYFIITENTGYDFRYAEILFINTRTGENEIVEITQLQKDAILVANSLYAIHNEETFLDITLNTNVEFETIISEDWIHLAQRVPTKSLAANQLSFRVESNPTIEERTATITFIHEDVSQTVTIVQDGRADKMNVEITHSEKYFYAPEFHGNNISGIVSWGDGSTSIISTDHSFDNNDIRISYFETVGVDVFSIQSINSISKIIFYCNEGKDGGIEDFDVEYKEWD